MVLLLSLLTPRGSDAEELEVPPRVQAELVGKLASYDRNFKDRAGAKAIIAILAKPADVDSARGAAQIETALKQISAIAGVPHEEILVPWNGAGNLAEICVKRKIAIVYLTPGLMGDVAAIARGLDQVNVLTVGSLLGYVSRGAILGFELVSGRPKLVVNLAQAKKQNVAFRAEVLKLMRIVN